VARVIDDGEFFTLKLSILEKVGALHGNIKTAKANLIDITNAENPWQSTVLRGIRAPGTGIPYVILLGTMRYKKKKDFTAIYRRRPVDIYTFKDAEFERWIISK
jgi:hypothetical protein